MVPIFFFEKSAIQVQPRRGAPGNEVAISVCLEGIKPCPYYSQNGSVK